MAIHGGPSPSPFWQPDKSSVPQVAFAALIKFALVLGIVSYQQIFTTDEHRAGACLAALGFIVIETTWTTIAKEDPATGNVSLTLKPEKLGHSSFAQFWSNVIWTPMILYGYRSLVANSWLRVALFPLNIWWLEIVEGYILMFIFGRNVAWEYRGRLAYFHGNITLQYYLPWAFLGGVVQLAWAPVIDPLIFLFAEKKAVNIVLPVAAALTLIFAPEMNLKAIFNVLKDTGGAEAWVVVEDEWEKKLGPFRGTSEHPEEDLLEGQIKVTGEEKHQETCCEKVSEQEVCLSREGKAQAALKCEGDAFAKHPEEEVVKSRSGEIQK
ncbi:hypothetical protein TrVE_jg8914 [Triparma verrucosa]|uniref:Uncharacterized protein n=1 Tax=Triparma verrucosa TaxID=1606542 RepID=A0A9W7EVH6_9STRA|nr:hypothetical protein TrVE_jg8914 [Triparma verrucosa]